jgi:hypothetical protein
MILMLIIVLILLSLGLYWYFEKQRTRRRASHLENKKELFDKLLESLKKSKAEDPRS